MSEQLCSICTAIHKAENRPHNEVLKAMREINYSTPEPAKTSFEEEIRPLIANVIEASGVIVPFPISEEKFWQLIADSANRQAWELVVEELKQAERDRAGICVHSIYCNTYDWVGRYNRDRIAHYEKMIGGDRG